MSKKCDLLPIKIDQLNRKALNSWIFCKNNLPQREQHVDFMKLDCESKFTIFENLAKIFRRFNQQMSSLRSVDSSQCELHTDHDALHRH